MSGLAALVLLVGVPLLVGYLVYRRQEQAAARFRIKNRLKAMR